jgi:hypothetical protein
MPSAPVATESQLQRMAAEAASIAAAISSGGAGIPPRPPDDNDPPEDPDDGNDDILRRLMEYLQQMFGVIPNINRNQFDAALRNTAGVLGANEDTRNQPSALAAFMDSFADYFGVGQMDNEEAEENLAEAIDRLTGAVNNNTNAQNNGNGQRGGIRGFIGRTVRRTGLRAARALARVARPVMRLAGRVVPRPILRGMQRAGANIIGGQAARMGVPPAAAARFGAALGPAAIAVGGLMIIASAATALAKTFKALADAAWASTMKLTDYSASLAFANASLQMNQELRKFRAGAAVADGGFFQGKDRIDAQNRLENAMAPLENIMTIVGNDIGTGLTNIAAFLVETMNSVLALGADILAALHDLVPDMVDQDIEANIRKNAEALRNPQAGNQFPNRWPGDNQLFGPQAPDVVDMARRMGGPRPQVGGGRP